VKPGPHQPEGLVELSLVPAPAIRPSKPDALAKQSPHVQSGGHDACLLVGNVVLQPRSRIDGQLDTLIDRAPQSRVILCGIEVVGIILGVINVVLGPVAA
jgi:hypothetical protein